MESKVGVGRVFSGDEDGVSLSDTERQVVDGELLEIGLSSESSRNISDRDQVETKKKGNLHHQLR